MYLITNKYPFFAYIFTGLSHVEKNRFSAMKNFIQRLRSPERQVQTGTPVQKSLESFCLQYTYPKCPQPKHIKGKRNTYVITHVCEMNVGQSLTQTSTYNRVASRWVFEFTDMDPAQNTVEDLMLRIGHLESVGNSKGVCLYTVDGMPLTDDPFFNTCEQT